MSAHEGRCVPVAVGLGVSAVSLLIGLAYGGGLLTVIFALIFAGIKYAILMYLCRTNQKSVAWVIVSLGIIGIVMTLATLNTPNHNTPNHDGVDPSGNLIMLSNPLLYGRGRWFNDPSLFRSTVDISGAVYFGTR